MRERALVVGAVATDSRAPALWDALRVHFALVEQPMEYVLHSTYDRLADALLAGQVDIAWNSPVAHLRVSRRTHGARVGVLGRDVDRDVRSVWFTRADLAVRRLSDLAGRTLAVGGRDHAFSRLIPLHTLRVEGVDLANVRLSAIEHEAGRHGATTRDEESIVAAVRQGRAQAGAVTERVWAGVANPGELMRIGTTAPNDGWVFDALPTLPTALRQGFERAMGSITAGEESGRRVLDLLGAQGLLPCREGAFEVLRRAMDEQTAW